MTATMTEPAVPAEAAELVGDLVLEHAILLAQALGWGEWATLPPLLQYHFRQVATAECFVAASVATPANAIERCLAALPDQPDRAIDDHQLQRRSRLGHALRCWALAGLLREGRVKQHEGGTVARYWKEF